MQAELIDYMGSDASVVAAARVSFANEGDSSRTEEQNERLIKYLAKHRHITPFQHTSVTVRVRAPVPIRTQCCNSAIQDYEDMLDSGVAEEQARFLLPQGCEVNWYWTGSLAAFARFYNQRTDSHAQMEIQDLAKEIGALIEPLYPICWKELTCPS
ncbi:thymidylate synthase [Vibrio phage vB_VspP_pVa5]|uniref:Thymidilate synthase protein n=1 Tax=Vibrio phage vB_VspP_pVa5 TaxID=1913109 RepID=A0A286M2S9_9CAUD|nr:thymidylate synthase [Vibrio phage vB_VspP_pVa5]ASV62328.1 thymidilate synthase protein [Vibrio phage vB_VspP_pVa5]